MLNVSAKNDQLIIRQNKYLVEKQFNRGIIMEKKWYKSKTIWVNVLSIAALYAQITSGFIFSIESQTAMLALINLMLRVVTKEEIVW